MDDIVERARWMANGEAKAGIGKVRRALFEELADEIERLRHPKIIVGSRKLWEAMGEIVSEAEMDHERIWLQNASDAGHQEEGRLWCPDKVWPDEPEDGEPTEYVRVDLYVAAQAEIELLRKQLYHATVAVDSIRDHALEEAAEVAEDFYPNQTYGIPIAFAIRALKESTE